MSKSQENVKNAKSQKKLVALSAMVMAAGTMVSRVLGLVREAVLASFFDRYVTDAFYVAFRLPNLFRRLLGEGSLSASFIPVFVDLLPKTGDGPTNEELQKARQFTSQIFSILLIILMVLMVLGVLFMDSIMGFLVSGKGYTAVPGKMDFTIYLGKIVFAFVFFIAMFAYFMAILNSLKKFMMAAFAPALLNVCLIISAFLPKSWFSVEGEALVWAALMGGALQAGVLIPQVWKSGYFPRFTTQWISPETKKVFTTLIPSLLGMGIVQIMALVNTQFASRLEQGSHSWLYWADRVLELPLSLFAVSLGTAILPTLSRFWRDGDRKSMTETANHYLRLIYFVSVPAAVGMFFLAQPIVEVLFFRGQFSATDVVKTTGVLQVYAFLLLTSSGVRVLAPSFFAIKNTWLPAMASGVGLSLHIIVAPIFMGHWGLQGLAMSSFISASLNLVLLLVAYYLLIGPLHGLMFVKSFGKFIIAAAAMSGFLWKGAPFLLSGLVPGGILQALMIFAVIGLAAGVYFAVAKLLKTPELDETLGTVLGKLKKRLS